jgi:hypothetical protein
VKDDLAHGYGHEAGHPRVPVRFDGAGHVDVAEDDAAKNRALRVRIARQHGGADCRIGIHRGHGKSGFANRKWTMAGTIRR